MSRSGETSASPVSARPFAARPRLLDRAGQAFGPPRRVRTRASFSVCPTAQESSAGKELLLAPGDPGALGRRA